jgi:hypothetical protein
MKDKKYIYVSVLILAIGGFFIYKELKSDKNKKLTKSESIDIIIDSGKHKNKEFISTFEDGFLIEWAKAILNKSTTFIYKTKEYNVQGGTSIKK